MFVNNCNFSFFFNELSAGRQIAIMSINHSLSLGDAPPLDELPPLRLRVRASTMLHAGWVPQLSMSNSRCQLGQAGCLHADRIACTGSGILLDNVADNRAQAPHCGELLPEHTFSPGTQTHVLDQPLHTHSQSTTTSGRRQHR